MKYLLRFLFGSFLIALVYGHYYKNYVEAVVGNKIIGFAVVGATFIFLPLFLYHRWNGKQLKDYTLSEENLKKMRENIEYQGISKTKKEK